MNDQKQALDLAAIRERREAAFEWVFAMCKGETRFKMSIPYQETDTDALLTAALKDSETLEVALIELREAYRRELTIAHHSLAARMGPSEALAITRGLYRLLEMAEPEVLS